MEEIRFDILQLKAEYRERQFRSLRELSQAGLTVDAGQYRQVYSDTCPSDVSLDEIYTRFNLDRPEDWLFVKCWGKSRAIAKSSP